VSRSLVAVASVLGACAGPTTDAADPECADAGTPATYQKADVIVRWICDGAPAI
jgi:hypothetical protein